MTEVLVSPPSHCTSVRAIHAGRSARPARCRDPCEPSGRAAGHRSRPRRCSRYDEGRGSEASQRRWPALPAAKPTSGLKCPRLRTNPHWASRNFPSDRRGESACLRKAIRLGKKEVAEGLEADSHAVQPADHPMDGSPLPDCGGIDASSSCQTFRSNP